MKTLLILTAILCGLGLQSAGAQTPPVKSIKYMRYTAKEMPDGKMVPDEISRATSDDGYYKLYDRDGRILEMCYLLWSDDIKKDIINVYNSDNQLIRQDEYYGDNERRGYRLFSYDGKGNLITEKHYSSNNGNGKRLPSILLQETTEYKYDGNNRKIRQESTSQYYDEGKSSPHSSTSYLEEIRYNEKNKILEKKRWRKDGREYKYGLIDRTLFIYDSKGNRTKETKYSGHYDGIERFDHIITYVYDSQNHIIEEKYYYSENNTEYYLTRYQYDNKGKLLLKESFKPGAVKWKSTKLRYDDKGYVTYEEQINYEKNTKDEWTAKYEFDSHKNWIKRTEWLSENGASAKPYAIVIREIKYHEIIHDSLHAKTAAKNFVEKNKLADLLAGTKWSYYSSCPLSDGENFEIEIGIEFFDKYGAIIKYSENVESKPVPGSFSINYIYAFDGKTLNNLEAEGVITSTSGTSTSAFSINGNKLTAYINGQENAVYDKVSQFRIIENTKNGAVAVNDKSAMLTGEKWSVYFPPGDGFPFVVSDAEGEEGIEFLSNKQVRYFSYNGFVGHYIRTGTYIFDGREGTITFSQEYCVHGGKKWGDSKKINDTYRFLIDGNKLTVKDDTDWFLSMDKVSKFKYIEE